MSKVDLDRFNDFMVEYKKEISKDYEKEIERLNKENNDLRRIYKNTYNKLFEKGNDELARYFQAQIDDCPTFYVEPIIDYYEETKRLNNIINEFDKWLGEELKDGNLQNSYYGGMCWKSVKAQYMERIIEKLQELKGAKKQNDGNK